MGWIEIISWDCGFRVSDQKWNDCTVYMCDRGVWTSGRPGLSQQKDHHEAVSESAKSIRAHHAVRCSGSRTPKWQKEH